jgi:NADH pyrophosphatase NudC (nudix superfamily)
VSRSYVYSPQCGGPLAAATGRARARCPARNKAWPPTWYALVAGFLERDEAPDEAVRREVKEELRLEALSTQLIGIHPFPRMNQVIMAYHVTATGPITLNEELVDYKLVDPADCTACRAGTGFALRDWLRSLPAEGGPAQHRLARGRASRSEPRVTDRPGEGDIEEKR